MACRGCNSIYFDVTCQSRTSRGRLWESTYCDVMMLNIYYLVFRCIVRNISWKRVVKRLCEVIMGVRILMTAVPLMASWYSAPLTNPTVQLLCFSPTTSPTVCQDESKHEYTVKQMRIKHKETTGKSGWGTNEGYWRGWERN